MNAIFINVVLCELATNHKTSSIYAESLDVNPGPDNPLLNVTLPDMTNLNICSEPCSGPIWLRA